MSARRIAPALLVALVLLAGAAARADEGPSRKAGVFVGFGQVRSGSFSKDMRAYADYLAIREGSSIPQSSVFLGFPIRLAGGFYVVPDVGFAGYGPTQQEGVLTIEYGAGLRWYVVEPDVLLRIGSASFVFYVQGSARWVTGTSQLDGFPMKSKGLSEELKAGTELCFGELWRHLRLGVELGWSNVPFKAPIDPAFLAEHPSSPRTALGGNYGGLLFAATLGWWFP